MDSIDRAQAEAADLPPTQGATMVVVTNRNPFIIRDRFDGVPFVFKPNETMTIPPEVAAHFFGWPADREVMNVYIAKRHGWNTKEYMQPADIMDPLSVRLYERYAENLQISVKEYVLVPKEATERPADDGVYIEDEDTPLSRTAADPTTTVVGIRKGSKAKRRGGRRSPRAPEPTDPPIVLASDME